MNRPRARKAAASEKSAVRVVLAILILPASRLDCCFAAQVWFLGVGRESGTARRCLLGCYRLLSASRHPPTRAGHRPAAVRTHRWPQIAAAFCAWASPAITESRWWRARLPTSVVSSGSRAATVPRKPTASAASHRAARSLGSTPSLPPSRTWLWVGGMWCPPGWVTRSTTRASSSTTSCARSATR